MRNTGRRSREFSIHSVVWWLGASSVALVLLGGCRSVPDSSEGDPPQMVDGSKSYTGPSIEHDVERGRHTFVVRTPTGGWQVRLTREEQIGSAGRVFLTMVRPGPDEMVTQAFVEHPVRTDLPSNRVVTVYARVLERPSPDTEAAFALVRRIEPK